MLLEQCQRRDHVALRLGHLLAVGIQHPARQGRVLPRQRVVLAVRSQYCVEEPRADDVVRLGPQVHRERAREQVRILFPPAHDLRRQRRGRPRVHDVRVAGETARLAALRLNEAGGHVGRRVDRQAILGSGHRSGVIDLPVRVQRIPHGKRHAEEPLAAHAPVAVQAGGPVLVPIPHIRRMPLEFASPLEQRLAELHGLDEPLAARDDLERPVALLVELHRVRDRPRLADQLAGRLEKLDDCSPGLGGRESGHAPVGIVRAAGLLRRPQPVRVEDDAPAQRAVGLDDGANGERQLAPPRHVGQVAERADHRDAAAFFRVGQVVRTHRNAHVEQRRRHLGAEERLVSLVVRVRDQRHARGDQLGPRCFDVDRPRAAAAEPYAMIGAGELAVLELRLGHGGPEVHIPQRGGLDLIRQAAFQEPQEGQLADALRPAVDRRVGHRPVD